MNDPHDSAPRTADTHNDVFISYARADEEFAKRLQKALLSYKVPLFSGLKPRRLRVFRDASDAADNRLPEGLSHALNNSRKLLVICSPASRNRPWVNEEVRQFARQKGAAHILPLLLAGLPNSEAERKQQPADAAFPPAVIEALGPEPWAPDFRQANSARTSVTRERTAWFHLLASLYQTTRAIIEQREKTRALTRACFGVIVATAVGYSIYQYIGLRKINDSIVLADRANKLLEENTTLEAAMRTATLATVTSPTTEATNALKKAVNERLDRLRSSMEGRAQQSNVVIDSTGDTVAIVSPLGRIRVWRQADELQHDTCGHFGPLGSPALSPDGRSLVWFDHGRSTLGFWYIDSHKLIEVKSGVSPYEGGRIRFSPDSKVIAFLPNSPSRLNNPTPVTPTLWRVSDRKALASLNAWSSDPQVTFSPDSTLLVQWANGDGAAVAVRQTVDGAMRTELGPLGGALSFTSFSADSKKLLVLTSLEHFKYALSSAEISAEASQRREMRTVGLREIFALQPDALDDEAYAIGNALRESLLKEHRNLLADRTATVSFATRAPIAAYKSDIPKPTAFVFDAMTLKIGASLTPVGPSSLALSPDGRFVVEKNGGSVWEAASGRRRWKLPEGVHRSVFSTDGSRLFVENRSVSNSSVVVYDTELGTEIARLPDVNTPAVDRLEALELLHVDGQGHRAVVRSGHSVFVWRPNAGTPKRLEGSYEKDKAALETDSEALQHANPKALLEIASRWLADCAR